MSQSSCDVGFLGDGGRLHKWLFAELTERKITWKSFVHKQQNVTLNKKLRYLRFSATSLRQSFIIALVFEYHRKICVQQTFRHIQLFSPLVFYTTSLTGTQEWGKLCIVLLLTRNKMWWKFVFSFSRFSTRFFAAFSCH